MLLMANAVMAQQADAGKPQQKFKGPIKVFILAGQSNMEGPAGVQALDRLGEHPTHGCTVVSARPVFRFATVAGYKYRLACKNVLTDATWQPVLAPPEFPLPDGWSATSTGTPMALSDTNTVGSPQRFYRLESANP